MSFLGEAQVVKSLEPEKETEDEAQTFRDQDLSGADLSGEHLEGVDLSGARLFKANLKGAILMGAKLDGADLTGADLTGAKMNGVSARNAGFGMAVLNKASLFRADFEGATFTMADLSKADLRCARLKKARLRQSVLHKVDFTEADLREADLSLCDVSHSTFDNADLRGARLRMMKGYEKASWIGTDIRDINFSGAYLLRRFIMDQNYLKEFKEKNKWCTIYYYLWSITSDCGRSILRWCLWIMLVVLGYAYLYTQVGIDYGDYPTPLSQIYYSMVTITTLGYGDVVPKTLAGQIVSISEVVIGYVMLGGLLSILSNRIARRAD